MRAALLLLLIAVSLGHLHAESLSRQEREDLLAKLKDIRETTQERVDERFRTAIREYRRAMSSNEAVIELYLKCVEKVDYVDRHRENSEFRDWKRRQENQLDDPAFRLALRHQLRWLELMLKSDSKDPDRNAIAAEAHDIMSTVFRDISKLQNQADTLKQSAIASVFARAYSIHTIDSKFPTSPLQVGEIFESVIFTPLRERGQTNALRSAWQQRIQLEEINAIGWAAHDTGATTRGKRDRERERELREKNRDEERVRRESFLTETMPELTWQMEVDLFKHGDEHGASGRMLAHIRNHLTHKLARQWGEELESLLNSGTSTAP